MSNFYCLLENLIRDMPELWFDCCASDQFRVELTITTRSRFRKNVSCLRLSCQLYQLGLDGEHEWCQLPVSSTEKRDAGILKYWSRFAAPNCALDRQCDWTERYLIAALAFLNRTWLAFNIASCLNSITKTMMGGVGSRFNMRKDNAALQDSIISVLVSSSLNCTLGGSLDWAAWKKAIFCQCCTETLRQLLEA